MFERIQRVFLRLLRSAQGQLDMGVAKIRRNVCLRDRNIPDAGVGQLVSDDLFQFFPDAFGDAFVAVGVQISAYNSVVMRALFAPITLWALAVLPVAGQPLQVFSEFARIDPSGKVTAPEFPREILSPGLIRNGFTSFQVVVQQPDGTPWELYVAQNPEDATSVTLYRIVGDKLELQGPSAKGSGNAVFWMDLWTGRDYPVERIKVEPQLHVNNDWVIYPMEARIMTVRVPDSQPAALPDLCGVAAEPPASGESTIAALHYRNANQDRALAAGAPRADLQKVTGTCAMPPENPEAYLRIRDYLFRRQGGA